MNKIIKVLFYLSVLMLLVSCATTRFEPKEDGSSTLVVGRWIATAKGVSPTKNGINLNKNYTLGIKLSLKELSTGKLYETKTIRRDGLFVFGNLDARKKYYVHQIEYKIEKSDGSSGWITTTYNPNSFPVNLKPDGVVVLGNFECMITEANGKLKSNLIDKDIPTDVRFSFMDLYPESKWLSKNWYYKNGLMPKIYSVDNPETQAEVEPVEEVNQEEYDDFLKELMGTEY